jgi:hypothetical protein
METDAYMKIFRLSLYEGLKEFKITVKVEKENVSVLICREKIMEAFEDRIDHGKYVLGNLWSFLRRLWSSFNAGNKETIAKCERIELNFEDLTHIKDYDGSVSIL